MRRYYFVDTSGPDTNLQLYALTQAKKQWAELQEDLSRDGDQVSNFHERCVFLICTMGLSLSQLLGQNNPKPTKRVPSPTAIFDALVDEHRLDTSLKQRFKEFSDAYDQCRHFGLTSNDKRHWEVIQVTLDKTRHLYEIGLLVWTVVIDAFRGASDSDLSELDMDRVEDDYF